MIEIGMTYTVEKTVTPDMTAKAVGSGGLEVFGTPFMMGLMEYAAMQCVQPELPEGKGTVGVDIQSSHLAPTPVGMTVTCESELTAVEGRKLAEDIGNRLTYIENYTSQVEQRSPETVTEYRAKLTARMEEVLQSTTIDPQRILQEAAIYADKVAVDEETVRLRSHVAQLRTMLESDEPMGRKMDFLIQEVNRESNTIGSKCNDLTVARDVVNMKAEVEKIREQVQNME